MCLSMCVSVCVCMCAYVSVVCVHACMHMWRPKTDVNSSSSHLFETGIFTEPDAHHGLTTEHWAPRCFSSSVLEQEPPYPDFHLNSGDPDLVLHASATSVLPTEPSSQPHFVLSESELQLGVTGLKLMC